MVSEYEILQHLVPSGTMAYRVILFLLLFGCLAVHGQNPINILRSPAAVVANDARLKATLNLGIPVVADTAHGLNGGLDSLGLIIQIRSTGKQYKRDTALTGGHVWTEIGSGSVTDTTSLSNRINLKVDSLTQSNDTTYYWTAGTRHFGGKGKISLATLLSVLGYAPLAPADTVYLHGLAAGKRDVNDTSYAHFLQTRARGQQIADSLGGIIATKVANFLGVSFLGYGAHSLRPTTGTGIYYDTDSSMFFYYNAGVATNMTPVFNLYLRGRGAPGDTTLVTASGNNLWIAAIRDSAGSCVHHVFNPDGSCTFYSTCGTGSAFDSLTSQGGVFHTGAYNDARYPVKSNNLADLPNAGTARTNLGLGTAATKNAPASGNAASTEVVLGNDTRLSAGLPSIANRSTLINVSGSSAIPIAGDLGVYNVLHYGAVDDSTVDSRSAILAAIAAMGTKGGTLYFPAGKYYISDSIIINKSIRIVGDGESLGSQFLGFRYGGSYLYGPANKTCMSWEANGNNKPVISAQHITIASIQTPGTPTYGAGIAIRGFLQRSFIDHCTVSGFYIDIQIESAFYWTISNNWIGSPVHSAVYCNDAGRTDTGDWGFFNNVVISGNFAGTAKGLEWNSGGGLKIYGNKFDAQSFTVNTQFTYPIWISNVFAATSDVQIENNSIEDYQITGIYDSCVNRLAHHLINNNHTAGVGSSGPSIVMVGASYVTLTGNIWADWNGVGGTPSMAFTNCFGVVASNNIIVGYPIAYSATTSTINKMEYYRSGGEGGWVSEILHRIHLRSGAGGPELRLVNDTTGGTFPQTAITFKDDQGEASNKGGAIIYSGAPAAAPFSHGFSIWNYANGNINFGSNNTHRGMLTGAGNWLFGTSTDPGVGAKVWVEGKLGVKTIDSVAIGSAGGGFVVRDFLTGLFKVVANPGSGTGSPGGPNTSLQINGSGSFIGYSSLTYDQANTRLYIGSGSATFPQLLSLNSSVNGPVGFTIENPNTGTSARTESLLTESSTKYRGIGAWNSTATGNIIGSIPAAETMYFYTFSGSAYNKAIAFQGNPVYALPGTSTSGYGWKQDASGFRIDQIGSLHTSNTTPLQVTGVPYTALDSTNLKLWAQDANGKVVKTDWPKFGTSSATPPAGSPGQVNYNNGGTPNVFGADAAFTWDAGNIRLGIGAATPLALTNLNIARTVAGSTGIGITNASTTGKVEVFGAQDGTHYYGQGLQGSAVSGNWPNTNFAMASSVYWYTFGSSAGQLPLFVNSNPFIVQVGQTTTNNGLRIDATGLRIGPSSGLGTSNTVGLEAPGTIKLNAYGAGSKTGTAATYPAFDASGNLIESATPYGTSFYQTVQSNTSSQTQRAKLNFGTEFTTTDNSGNGSTDISVNAIAESKVTSLTADLAAKKAVIFAQTADQTFNNTTTNTTSFGTGVGSRAITSGTLAAGKTIHLKGMGKISTAAAGPTAQFTFDWTTSSASSTPTLSGSTTYDVEWDLILTVRTTGSSGTGAIGGYVSYNGTKIYFNGSIGVSLNTTTTITPNFLIAFGTADPSNIFTSYTNVISID